MLQKRIYKFKIIHLLSLCIILAVGAAAFVVSSLLSPTTNPPAGEQKVNSKEIQVIGSAPDQRAALGSTEKRKVVESKPIKAEFQFNAIAPHWKETAANEENRKVEIRTSLDEKKWSPWMEIEAAGPLRDDDPHPDRKFTEAPLLIDGRYFQYRIALSRNSLKEPTPQVYDLKISHIDSRKPKQAVIREKIMNFFKSDKAVAAQQHPRIITRSEWGSPDPYGNYFKGTDKHWPASHVPVKQVFIHHTVTANYQADPSAAVRAIWDFHANTRGWGDVGYNYLVDHQGNIYQGRLGGDNAVGGHVFEYNRGSLGVSMLGCFDSANETCKQLNGGTTPPPNNQVLNGLSSLLSNKTTSFEIDPYGSNNFCNSSNQNCLNLPTITGHRDANNTTCPGDLTVNRLQSIRDATRAKNTEGWLYSAKQLDYGPVDLSSASSKNVTLRFKNTGRSTWSNSSNKSTLYMMEPPGRSSAFQGSGWLTNSKPALLNEPTVGPGSIGSFTFNVNRPNIPPGNYHEAYTLITESGSTPGSFYSLPFIANCTIGQAGNPRPNGSLIKDSSNGKTYFIEDGKKRYITSALAAATNGHDLPYAITVSPAETALLTDGLPINIREGTLLKSNSSASVYILDETPAGYARRAVPSSAVMAAFGMKFEHVQTISQNTLSSYAAGPTLQTSLPAPDGRLIKSSTDSKVYLVENGQRRHINSPLVFTSYGFGPEHIGSIDNQKVNQLPIGPTLNLLRRGTLVKSASASSVYATDIITNSGHRRRISSPHAFNAAGFRSEAIVVVPDGMLNTYSEGSSIECYK